MQIDDVYRRLFKSQRIEQTPPKKVNKSSYQETKSGQKRRKKHYFPTTTKKEKNFELWVDKYKPQDRVF